MRMIYLSCVQFYVQKQKGLPWFFLKERVNKEGKGEEVADLERIYLHVYFINRTMFMNKKIKLYKD